MFRLLAMTIAAGLALGMGLAIPSDSSAKTTGRYVSCDAGEHRVGRNCVRARHGRISEEQRRSIRRDEGYGASQPQSPPSSGGYSPSSGY